jgi:hypothetical protein
MLYPDASAAAAASDAAAAADIAALTIEYICLVRLRRTTMNEGTERQLHDNSTRQHVILLLVHSPRVFVIADICIIDVT